jgi:hypothetical protein
MRGNPHVEMVRAVVATMILVFSTIATYLLISPVIYQVLDVTEAQFNSASPTGDAAVWGPRIYDVLNAVFATLTVFAVLAELAALYLYARRRYYASGEVIIQ